jgi:3-deoxy-D-manno-octulosonic-acid transferase
MIRSIAMLILKWGFSIAGLWDKKARLRVKGLKRQVIPAKGNRKRVWLHCASAGEYEQVVPVIRSINMRSDVEVVISFFSPSGMEYYHMHPHADVAIYLPFDWRKDVERFVEAIQPDVVIWVKYEFWFNTLLLIHEKGIPLYLINADLYGLARKKSIYGDVIRNSLPLFDKVFAVSSSTELETLCKAVELCFDSKWVKAYQNIQIAFRDVLIERWISDKPCIVLGSTHIEDINFLCETISRHLHSFRWLIVPHEVNATIPNHVKEIFSAEEVAVYTENPSADCPIMVMDKMGVLKYIYRYADAAYIGGGFGKAVHNTLEAAAYAIPVACGPKTAGMPETLLLQDAGLLTLLKEPKDFENFIQKMKGGRNERISNEALRLFAQAQKGNVVESVTAEVLQAITH